MLTEIPQHYQDQFASNWVHLVQQMDCRLEGAYTDYPVDGKRRSISQLGTSSMRPITTRNGVTTASDANMEKRWIIPAPYDEVTYIDEWDEDALGNLPAPESEFVQSHAYAANRKMDEIMIAALEGTAYTGETGAGTATLGSSQQVAVDYVRTGTATNSGLTLAKIIRAAKILNLNEVEDEGRYFIYSADQLEDLLADVDQVSNSRYAEVKALMDGQVNYFMGFRWIRTELLTLNSSTDVRTCIAYQRLGLAFGCTPMGRKHVKMDIRPDLNHTIQIRTTLNCGATRTEEKRVVLVYCDESP